MKNEKLLLVGDNPFHGVSHLSQERAISRGKDLANPAYCADLVRVSLKHGADGFMCTISETTLSILDIASKAGDYQVQLYTIVPYVPEFVRTAATSGGIPGLSFRLGKQVTFSGNFGAIINGLRGVITGDPASLLRSYLSYEVFRLRSAMGKRAILASIMWHEVMTDMALALNMRWFFNAHIDFMLRQGIRPGFETRNFACLVEKFEKWGMDFGRLTIAAPFNAAGFQMCPSQDECEKALQRHPEAEVIGFSLLAAGRLNLSEAGKYLADLSGLKGVAVGVSTQQQARQTFGFLRGIIVQ